MSVLVIYSSKDEPGKKDATGAFIPEAFKFASLHGVPKNDMCGVECPRVKKQHRAEKVLEFLYSSIARRDDREVDLIAWFCHGWSTGIQVGFGKDNIEEELIEGFKGASPELKHVFYACSTASTSKESRSLNAPGTNGGFADTLRDYMVKNGFKEGWIDAHLTPGHTTQNPNLFRFYVDNAFDDTWDLNGGDWIISPKTPLWLRWKHMIRHTDFRYYFPMRTQTSIINDVNAHIM